MKTVKHNFKLSASLEDGVIVISKSIAGESGSMSTYVLGKEFLKDEKSFFTGLIDILKFWVSTHIEESKTK